MQKVTGELIACEKQHQRGWELFKGAIWSPEGRRRQLITGEISYSPSPFPYYRQAHGASQ